MTCVILQPSYIPWRGYFHQIQKADVFVFYDDVQYDKHGWRNRNQIKSAQGPQWLTIPVLKKGNVELSREIREIQIAWDRCWTRKHLETITHCYRKAPFFEWLLPDLKRWYSSSPQSLVDFTIPLTIELARLLGLDGRRFVRSSELGLPGHRSSRLIDIVKRVGCHRYVSGPSARDYLEESAFAESGIELEYMSYEYGEYPQLHGPFDPQLSILDLLVMTGPNAPKHVWSA